MKQKLLYFLGNREVRRYYYSLKAGSESYDKSLLHPLWSRAQPKFVDLISRGVLPDFLSHPELRYMFYRSSFGPAQEHELCYLRQSDYWDLVQHYRESPIGRPVIDCPDLNISVNSLGMLYYFSRILEHVDQSKLCTIVEFGGGYGSLCRVFLDLLPGPLTYVIIDLPEMLALQYAYLKGSSPHHNVEAPTSQPTRIRAGSVNLMPMHWAKELALTCDLFISTFALSEASKAAQSIVVGNEFFGAGALYLVGQQVDAELWRELALESMEPVQRAASDLYPNMVLQPFHFADSWELAAWRNRS